MNQKDGSNSAPPLGGEIGVPDWPRGVAIYRMRKHGNSRGKGTNCANGNLEIGGAEATLVARHIGQ